MIDNLSRSEKIDPHNQSILIQREKKIYGHLNFRKQENTHRSHYHHNHNSSSPFLGFSLPKKSVQVKREKSDVKENSNGESKKFMELFQQKKKSQKRIQSKMIMIIIIIVPNYNLHHHHPHLDVIVFFFNLLNLSFYCCH